GAHRHRLPHQLVEAGGVEVDIGESGEQGEVHKAVDRRQAGAEAMGTRPVHGDALHQVDQHVLKIGGGGVLAADAPGEATAVGAVGGAQSLFTLDAKHGVTPVG